MLSTRVEDGELVELRLETSLGGERLKQRTRCGDGGRDATEENGKLKIGARQRICDATEDWRRRENQR